MPDSQERSVPVTEVAQLVDYLASGCKPRSAWRIGTEHEKFGYRKSDLRPLPYEGEQGIGAILHGLERFGWTPVREAGKTIALTLDGQSVTLEPGGQLELSGAQLESVHQTCDEVNVHLDQVRSVAEELDVAFFGVGFQPKWALGDIPVMPKGRYGIMRAYMPTRGALGLEMMFRTCTVQTNLDFESEADMVRKFRVALALQPVATALYANSPFTDGKPNGYLSYRSQVWTDTDEDRCGTLPFVFEDGMGFERYAEHALDVPMYFVYRDGAYIDASGQSFRDFIDGRLPALPGEHPRIGDWEDHLTTLFPEARLKRFLEVRGADGGPWRRLCALPAFWVGLLYDDGALDAAWDMVKTWTEEERESMRREVPRRALATPFRGRTVADLAREAVDIAAAGLRRRGCRDRYGETEEHFLDALHVILEAGRTPAEEHLIAFRERWGGSVDPLFTEIAY